MVDIKKIGALSGFRHGLGAFGMRIDRKWCYGILNADGEIVLEPQYRFISVIGKEFALVRTSPNALSKCIDISTNKVLCSRVTSDLSLFEVNIGDKLVCRGRKGDCLVDLRGNVLIPDKCGYFDFFPSDKHGNYYRVVVVAENNRDKWGVVASDGRVIIPFIYDHIGDSDSEEYDSIIPVYLDKKWFFIDRNTGQRLSDKDYEHLWSGFFKEGCAIFQENGKCGLIDTAEQVIVPAQYNSLLRIGDNRWQWMNYDRHIKYEYDKTKEGVINCFGEQVFPYIDNVTFGRGFVSSTKMELYFQGSYIVRTAEDYNISRYGVMSEDGKIVIPLEFNAIRRYGDVYMVRHITTGRYGLYSLVGDVVLPCEYELMDIGDTLDYIAVRKDGEWYYVNRRGERVLL